MPLDPNHFEPTPPKQLTQVQIAKIFARMGHEGQVDKAGKAYIAHPARVAASLADDDAKAVAWLHDILEDTPLTREELLAGGVKPHIVEAVEALTKKEEDETPEAYMARVIANPIALRVKIADTADNIDLSRFDKPVTEVLADPKNAARHAKYIKNLFTMVRAYGERGYAREAQLGPRLERLLMQRLLAYSESPAPKAMGVLLADLKLQAPFLGCPKCGKMKSCKFNPPRPAP